MALFLQKMITWNILSWERQILSFFFSSEKRASVSARCAIARLRLRDGASASQRLFGQNMRVTDEWSTGVFRYHACEFRRRRGRRMLIAPGGLFLLVSFKLSVTMLDILPWSFRSIYETLFLPWGHSIIEVLRKVIVRFYSVLFLLPLLRG